MADVLKTAEESMKHTIEAAKKEFNSIRSGRANPSLLDRIHVNYYGTPTPLNQVATITAPEPRLIVIQPWVKDTLGEIEKAIQKADLGLNPNNDGNVIRLNFPTLTEERRKELVKMVKKMAEEMRVAIRNIRRDANDSLKKLEKEEHVSEDEVKRAMDEVQELTDKYIEKIDKLLEAKEAEIMEV
ncbi:MAG: ribosome recycling factor [Firmicutes bacterium]|nr:ribosome recycling factor [Bacillota bacterium]